MPKEINQFFEKIAEVYRLKQPFVVYRKPNEELVTLMVQNSLKLNKLHSFNEAGFLFAPFYKEDAKILFPKEESSIFQMRISQYEELAINENILSKKINSLSSNSKENYVDLINKAIEFIKENNAQKIVLSRNEVVEFSHFSFITSLKKMLKNYTNAFVYAWFHPKVGLWLGATPERLLTITNGNFKTMALAGTQFYNNTVNVIWEEKEKEEQQIVTNFIIDNIKNEVNITEVNGPYTVKAGSLLHLRTDISGELTNVQMLEKLLLKLHPTPAVCGLPKEVALNFILSNEHYKRTYYAGYLGELNLSTSTQLFVNLRCMEIQNKYAKIFVGGGITKDSVSDKEYDETVFKTMIMKNVL